MTTTAQTSFLQAMRALTSAVTIISTDHGGRRFGMVATAVSSLSLDPPSLLACVNLTASIHEPLLARGFFCVSVLHASQEHVARAFASAKGEDRFLTGSWATDDRSPPYLEDAQANFICAVEASYVHATHRIFIGRALEVLVRSDVDPLLYQDGRYTGAREQADWNRAPQSRLFKSQRPDGREAEPRDLQVQR